MFSKNKKIEIVKADREEAMKLVDKLIEKNKETLKLLSC